MPASGLAALVVIGGTCLHLLLGRWVLSPWLMPDLTFLSMASALLLMPGRPFSAVLVGGVLVTLMSVERPLLMGLAYAGAGWLVLRSAVVWDVETPALQRLLIAAGESLILALGLIGVPWTAELLAGTVVRLGMTIVCLPLVRSVVARVVR
ncbi:MAG: hypothetical protein HYY91_03665 [Candidatus Omnitrophica bacterium]|nr:hypothetical protein [Candidatus Omnitrophota bacterium]